MRLADYLVGRLPELTGSNHCFIFAGGGIMHLLDAIGKSSIVPVSMHHEQAVVIAADAYGRINNKVGISFVTSGPGATNAITGVAGAWMESTPLIVISGQVSRATWKGDSGVRQMGFQEIDIIPIIKSITKYSAIVLNPLEIRYHLEKALYIAKSGRPGPVWLDIPIDVQAARINEIELKAFDKSEVSLNIESIGDTKKNVQRTIDCLSQSKRPLLLGGHGVWLSDAKKEFRELVNILKIPVQTSWNGIDLIEDNHPLYFGRHNSYGPRYPNFIVQNCDLLISIGSRLGLQQIGFNYRAFAREAKKIVVDIDPFELKKQTIKPDVLVNADAKLFLEELISNLDKEFSSRSDISEWIEWCREKKRKFPICDEEYYIDNGYVDPYVFIEKLSDILPPDVIIIPGSSGTCFTVTNQVFKIKKGQRFFSSKGLAAMGYGLPSSIGGCFSATKKETITIIGDGGFQLNIQELQTIVHHQLPIKMFIFNNCGYLSIRTTQEAYFNGHYVGSDIESGVSIPEFEKIAYCYGLSYKKIEDQNDLTTQIHNVLKTKGPVICEVILNPKKVLLPKLSSYKKQDGTMESKPLEDLYPHLSKKVLKDNMIIDLWK